MDNTVTHHIGRSNLRGVLLLLLLSGLQPVLSTDGEEPQLHDNNEDAEKVACTIVGPEYVTVSVPSSVECDSDCQACTFSLSLDGQSAVGQGNVLAFTVTSWAEALTVTCTVTAGSGLTATATKRLQVLAGPANVSISGPGLMHPSVSHTYSCHAYCRPSCTYAWKTDRGPWLSGQGNVISITPKEISGAQLVCKATNSVSKLFVAAVREITVISGPPKVEIIGPDVIEIAEKYTYVCSAECTPACRYVLSVNSQTVRGPVMEIMVDHPLKSLTLKCEAQNTASKSTAVASKTVQIARSDRNPSSRPGEASAVLLLAVIISALLPL
ncbi:uncharacterized protein LOC119210174 isoform X2 [Pungitius pungitius]|uniref:uncharacterized protein LOC119210174 isoform X2 n=1 Tax=Pungitius pungitius TaxID=134920 RepID=UPI002E129703